MTSLSCNHCYVSLIIDFLVYLQYTDSDTYYVYIYFICHKSMTRNGKELFLTFLKVLFHTYGRKILFRKHKNWNVAGFGTAPLWKPSKRSGQLSHTFNEHRATSKFL